MLPGSDCPHGGSTETWMNSLVQAIGLSRPTKKKADAYTHLHIAPYSLHPSCDGWRESELLRITDASAPSLARVRHALRHCPVLLLHTTLCTALASRITTPPQGSQATLAPQHLTSVQTAREALRNIHDTRGALLASSASLPCQSAALSTFSQSTRCKYKRNEFTLPTVYLFGTPALGSQVLRTGMCCFT